jgi:DNA-3-methyladenine glycosylase II
MRKAIQHLRKADPVLASIIEQVGPYRIEFRDPEFGTLVRSIVYQQLSGKVASVILARLISALPGRKLTPRGILKVSVEDMRAVGLSSAKTAYIRDLAERTLAGDVVFKTIHTLSDDEVIEHLTQVKGIGVWTAHMFLIFALQRPDVLPTGDLGVRVAMKKAYGLADLPKPQEMQHLAESWRPYCSVATWYLWRSLDSEAQI